MSRVDIIATSRSTGETLASEGFCRGPSLQDYCGDSPDPVLQDFAWHLSMGCHLDASELPAFVQRIEEVLHRLQASPHPDDPRFPGGAAGSGRRLAGCAITIEAAGVEQRREAGAALGS